MSGRALVTWPGADRRIETIGVAVHKTGAARCAAPGVEVRWIYCCMSVVAVAWLRTSSRYGTSLSASVRKVWRVA